MQQRYVPVGLEAATSKAKFGRTSKVPGDIRQRGGAKMLGSKPSKAAALSLPTSTRTRQIFV